MLFDSIAIAKSFNSFTACPLASKFSELDLLERQLKTHSIFDCKVTRSIDVWSLFCLEASTPVADTRLLVTLAAPKLTTRRRVAVNARVNEQFSSLEPANHGSPWEVVPRLMTLLAGTYSQHVIQRCRRRKHSSPVGRYGAPTYVSRHPCLLSLYH